MTTLTVQIRNPRTGLVESIEMDLEPMGLDPVTLTEDDLKHIVSIIQRGLK
jgi:hypothetical protein